MGWLPFSLPLTPPAAIFLSEREKKTPSGSEITRDLEGLSRALWREGRNVVGPRRRRALSLHAGGFFCRVGVAAAWFGLLSESCLIRLKFS